MCDWFVQFTQPCPTIVYHSSEFDYLTSGRMETDHESLWGGIRSAREGDVVWCEGLNLMVEVTKSTPEERQWRFL